MKELAIIMDKSIKKKITSRGHKLLKKEDYKHSMQAADQKESLMRSKLAGADMVVMKFGTNSLSSDSGICRNKIRRIANEVSRLMEGGKRVVIITSGAVAMGMEKNGLKERPESESELQDLAAEGQYSLMSVYEKEFKRYGIGVWQILLTHHNFQTQADKRNVIERIYNAFRKNKISILNTNDPVTKEELLPSGPHTFSDNDPLAALVAKFIHADALIIFSDSGNKGKGGGESKQRAIDLAKESGVEVVITSIEKMSNILR